MTELFEQHAKAYLRRNAPLAERMRPAGLEDIVGQPEVTGAGGVLRAMIAERRPRSLIFWGPPGTGKTTLARIAAKALDAALVQLSATASGVKDIRAAIDAARARLSMEKKPTVVFIDEIHRFNKSQQDTLLHSVEDGTLTLLGATTENPSFEVNAALLSRCRLVILKHLEEDDLRALLRRALNDGERGLGEWALTLTPEAETVLLRHSAGDARVLLNGLELAAIKAKADLAAAGKDGKPVIDERTALDALGRSPLLYDKSGEEHYNLASALIKSMRGSDADAAVYYAVRMLEGGEEPGFVARRMAIFASEDVGNADPHALVLAAAAIQVVEFIGLPEAMYTLTQLAAYLALAPKSDGAKRALGAAKELVRTHGPLPTPLSIRNAPTKMMKELGYGKGYRDGHEEEGGIVPESLLPEKIAGARLYFPLERGYEARLKERLEKVLERRKANKRP